MKCAVAVFAKTAGLSSVKTRLAASIGKDQAEKFYCLSVAAIRETLSLLNEDFSVHWALAEKEAVEFDEWQDLPALWTGEGGLGTRVANISETLFQNHDAVMLVGTDSPQLETAHFEGAMRKLQKFPDACIAGPAEDGGFYLFLSAQPVTRAIWESVSYSQSDTLAQLVVKLAQQEREIIHLSAEQDVDMIEDLTRLQGRMEARFKNLNRGQKKLLDWLNDNSNLF